MVDVEKIKHQQKAIVVGASSGIGWALAKVLGNNGYEVGLASRRVELLRELQQAISTQTYIKRIDVRQTEEAMGLLRQLIQEMQGVDLIVLNSGINTHNVEFDWKGEAQTIEVNISGFAALANVAVKYFLEQGAGHLVGISSIATLRGNANSPAYSASKAFVANYLEGLRHKLARVHIYVTDIRPGLVDTPLIAGQSRLFWVASPEGAAEQIFQAIKKKAKVAYITRRWAIVAWLMRLLPDWVYRFRYRYGC